MSLAKKYITIESRNLKYKIKYFNNRMLYAEKKYNHYSMLKNYVISKLKDLGIEYNDASQIKRQISKIKKREQVQR